MPRSENETVLKLTIEDGFGFKNFITALKEMISRAAIDFTEEGMSIIAVSDARIGYVELQIPATNFSDSYECAKLTEFVEDEDGKEDEIEVPVTIQLNIKDLEAILSKCRKNDSISIEYEKVLTKDEETEDELMLPDNKIKIKLEGETEKGRKRTRNIELSLEELEEEYIIDGNLEEIKEVYTWHIDMDKNVLKDAITDAKPISEVIEFEIKDKTGFRILANSLKGTYDEFIEATESSVEEIGDEEVRISIIEGKEMTDFNGFFPIDKIEAMLKMAEESDGKIAIQLATTDVEDEETGEIETMSAPMMIQINVLVDGVTNYFIAPQFDE